MSGLIELEPDRWVDPEHVIGITLGMWDRGSNILLTGGLTMGVKLTPEEVAVKLEQAIKARRLP